MIAGLRRGAGATLVLMSWAGVGSAELPTAAAPAAPSAALVQALEDAPLVLVGEVGSVSALGGSAYRTRLAVEQVLAGSPPGGPVGLAWEERAPSRPPRFAAGDRVLVGLKPLAMSSGWRDRLAPFEGRGDLLTIAADGQAWYPQPGAGELGLLEHLLALAPSARSGADGARHLLALAARAGPQLARSAAARLQQTDAGAEIAPETLPLVIEALARPGTTGVPTAMVEWVAVRRPPGLAEALDGALRKPGAAAGWFEARAQLDAGGVDFDALARHPSAAMRGVAARTSSDPTQLAGLAADADPAVREDAVTRLADAAPDSPALERALGDAASPVRAAAARGLAARGDVSIAALHRVTLEEASPARETALAALGLIGTSGSASALAEIASSHPDPGMRQLAEIALTRTVGHVHQPEP